MPTYLRPERKISPHFRAREFGRVPTRYLSNLERLATHLEHLRAANGGRQLQIVSGYRSALHNRAVGGAKRSQHLTASAADIPYGYATVEEAIMAGFTGIGSKGPYAVHVDVRPGPLARWTY